MSSKYLNILNVNEKFANWATSISGMSGGNPNGDIWFCGIEFGGDDKEFNFENTKYDIEKKVFPCWDNELKINYPNYTKSQYFQKQAKIICYLSNQYENWREYLKDYFLSADDNCYSLNLFPLSFVNTDSNNWRYDHYLKTGIRTKIEYIVWCIQNRFPFLNSFMKTFNPKIIICSGTSYKKEFLLAFSDNVNDIYNELPSVQLTKKKKIEWIFVNNNKTLLVITPFLGQGGLMSDKSLFDLSDFIKSKVDL